MDVRVGDPWGSRSRPQTTFDFEAIKLELVTDVNTKCPWSTTRTKLRSGSTETQIPNDPNTVYILSGLGLNGDDPGNIMTDYIDKYSRK